MKVNYKKFNHFKDNDRVEVSVIIVAYNHQKYIEQTLSSILEQETKFDFEVIIHDDCTPDLPFSYYEDVIKIALSLFQSFINARIR
ncbi:glycosyltransferase family 2 protein [Vibrio fortis]|uniref:Glycosyltransferase family 2 protein n=1 Tax=Vibrio fortis TaxID=212667 RepID=A0A5N3S6T6_9VIBR|nr:glycosyltransferase [Vibrio fortis]KAB0302217.1 glycosyltransferase family 2 protein [Vibrio fortis]